MTEQPRGRDREVAAPERLEHSIRASGLVHAGDRVIALVSGGPDSACLAAGLNLWLEPGNLVALHLNYGLRPESDADAAMVSRLCEGLGIDLVTIAAESEGHEGNTQAWARRLRYEAAEQLRAESDADWIAAGHTATDAAETLLYRLASSPGTRSLPGMRPRMGKVIRPLLGLERHETREIAVSMDLKFVDDASNLDPGFARVRIRAEVLPALEKINPAAVKNIVATQAEILEEADLLQTLARQTVSLCRADDDCLSVDLLVDSPAALRRLALRSFAESVLGRSVPLSVAKTATVLRLAEGGEGGRVDLGGGATLVVESGVIRVVQGDDTQAVAKPAELKVPGSCGWGEWAIRAEVLEPGFDLLGPEVATLDAEAVGKKVTVRSWQSGDRIDPLGMTGGKSLQDLFTDRGVPRSLRHRIPVLLVGHEVAWVAGVAIGRRFRIRETSGAAIRLSAVKSPRSP